MLIVKSNQLIALRVIALHHKKTFSLVESGMNLNLPGNFSGVFLEIMLLCYRITLGRYLGNVRFGLLVFFLCDENKPINPHREHYIERRISVLSTSGLLFSQLHVNF